MSEIYKSALLENATTCYRYLQVGFGVIIATFAVGAGVLFVPSWQAAYEILVMPALFVGLGLLLYGVGTHLHIMHLNVLEMRVDDQH